MSAPKTAEPSMDEILASIRKIITDDGGGPGGDDLMPADSAGDAGLGAHDDDVLVLTERAPPELDDSLNTQPETTVAKTPADNAEPLVGSSAAEAAASSFDNLSTAIDTAAPPAPSLSGRSLEDVTRELLAPLLKAWLEENLPAIVRERVDEEVARIARLRVR